MLLQKIIEYPSLSLNYLERYVNEGSPSGFSQKYTSSEKTNPFTGDDNVSLFVIDNRHYSLKHLQLIIHANYPRMSISFYIQT